ncbi:uncharacterized protein LOC135389598 [Ornithodoros turicata]|uniref:uncharacterized protein LOC135389598 n=1 Tax=Ornithodoros turicata TaxID=34597 RepID=UPI0031394802
MEKPATDECPYCDRCFSTGARQLKSQGSVKTGGTCLAHMTVCKDGTEVRVNYQSSHLGHNFELCHTTLSTTEKAGIAAKLQEGVTMDAVLDGIRNNLDGTLDRIHLATRQDLHNIMRDFKITYNEKLHENDYISGELLDEKDFLLVIMMPPQEQLLKALGTDRLCIDGTHGTTGIDKLQALHKFLTEVAKGFSPCVCVIPIGFDFELVTLLCVDEFGSGFPCAFCITSRTDYVAMKIFFGAIKERTGILHVNTFMSDDAPAFYNAWKDTMGKADRQLLCTWHVDKNWRENIRKHVKGKEAQEFTYKALRTLMDEADEGRFQELLKAFLEECATQPAMELFLKYFTRHYAGRTNVWAACYRIGAGINTNMRLEALHRVLKYCYLQGKHNKRVDRLISALLRLMKNKLFDRLIKFSKNVPGAQVKEIVKRHEAGVHIPQEHICNVGTYQWSVKSQSSEGVSYTVTQQPNTDCTSSTCSFRCPKCVICVHNFTCTCIDNTVRLGLCKHIHAVAATLMNAGHLKETVLQLDEQVRYCVHYTLLQGCCACMISFT